MTDRVTSGTAARDRLVHDALLYGSDNELLRDIVPFLRAGLDAGETVMMACTEPTATLLIDALGDAARIERVPTPETYQRPAEAILAYQQLLEDQLAGGARHIRWVGEVISAAQPAGQPTQQPTQQPAGWPEWLRFDAVLNRALASYPLWGVCLYDLRQLPAELVTAVQLTHPYLRTPPTRATNPAFLDPAEFLRRLPDPGLDPLEATQPTLAVDDLTSLQHLRRQLADVVVGSALPAWTTGEFVFVASEVATNALRHGRLPVRVRVWVTPSRLLCTVTDQGPGIADPLVGYMRAHRDPSRGGLGLWLARRLCDQVDLRRTSEGFTVRLTTGR